MFTVGPAFWGGARRPAFANVQLLLHFDGASGSFVFPDSSLANRTVSETGSGRLSTVVVKYGTASLGNTGSSYTLSVTDDTALQVGSGPFTLEMWAYIGAVSGTISKQFEWELAFEQVASDRKIRIRMGSDGSSYSNDQYFPAVGSGYAVSTWFHLAFERVGDTVTVYINGVSMGTMAFSGSVADTTSLLRIGKVGAGPAIQAGSFIDDLRFTVGEAVYQGAFSPPTAALPDA